jgi:hypothetical protein
MTPEEENKVLELIRILSPDNDYSLRPNLIIATLVQYLFLNYPEVNRGLFELLFARENDFSKIKFDTLYTYFHLQDSNKKEPNSGSENLLTTYLNNQDFLSKSYETLSKNILLAQTNTEEKINELKEKINVLQQRHESDIEELDYFFNDQKVKDENLNLLYLDQLKKDTAELKTFLYNYSTSYNLVKKIQYIPVNIYLSEDNAALIENVYDSVIKYIESLDFIKSIEFAPQRGSWFKRLVAASKFPTTTEAIDKQLKWAEISVDLNLAKVQSEIDKNQSEAFSNVSNALSSISNAAIQIGSLIVVKLTNDDTKEPSMHVRTLSNQELTYLSENPDLLLKPNNLLKALEQRINTKFNS